MSKLARRVGIIVSLASILGAPWAWASGGGESFKEGVNYLAIKPPMIVNYGGPGRVKYIKAELSLRTEDMHSAAEASHHMPLIRDTLIMLISSVTDEQMASADGKEQMRVTALAKINEALEQVNHPVAEPGAKAHKAAEPDTHKDPKSSDGAAHGGGHKGPPVSDLLFDNLVVQK